MLPVARTRDEAHLYGSDEPPASAFWSDDGRAERQREPGRFLREALLRYRAYLAGRR